VKRSHLIAGAAVGALGLFYLVKRGKTETQPPPGPRKVLAIGDSLTASKYYCQALSNRIPLGGTVTCRGLEGQGTGAILADFKIHYPPKKLNYFTDVIVLAGVNDIASGRSVETVIHNLSSIYYIIKQSGARIIAVQLTPWYGYKYRPDWEEKTQAINKWIKSSPLPDAVVDTFHLGDFQGRLLENYTSGDGLHLNQAGSQKLASLVIQQGL
jgi:lysophospholipase L1-like esterase